MTTAVLADQLALVGRVGLAGLLGAVVGLEREWSRKPAGLRTHFLVAAAACLLVGLGEPLVARFPGGAGETIRADPLRLIQSIVLGVSFLGAGTIVVNRDAGRVEGLTTAAGVLVTTGVGIAVALGQLVVATVTSLLTVVVLAAFGLLEARWGR